jgi:hypothetical protein
MIPASQPYDAPELNPVELECGKSANVDSWP